MNIRTIYIYRILFSLLIILGISISQTAYSENTKDQHINRLFLTPEFRAQIDLYRTNPDLYKPKETITRGKEDETISETPQSSTITIKGIITKPDGSKIAWINEEQTPQLLNNQNKIDNNAVLVNINEKTTIKLKAGQTFNTEDNTVKETFNAKQESIESSNSDQDSSDINTNNNSAQNAEQSVEEPHEITKTLIDIVNHKKSTAKFVEREFEP